MATSPQEDTRVLLQVGSAIFDTTQEILLGRDSENYFHAHLRFSSGTSSWADTASQTPTPSTTVITVPERSGRLFQDVLYYLRFGLIPYDKFKLPLLDKASLQALKDDAEFYLLPGLVKLCSKHLKPFGGFGSGVGDFLDKSCNMDLYSNFELYVSVEYVNLFSHFTEVSYNMQYTYNQKTRVAVDYEGCDGDFGKAVNIRATMENVLGSSTTTESPLPPLRLLDNTIFNSTFGKLEATTAGGCDASVAALLDVHHGDIPPEIRLWWAFVAHRMLQRYKDNTSQGVLNFDRNVSTTIDSIGYARRRTHPRSLGNLWFLQSKHGWGDYEQMDFVED